MGEEGPFLPLTSHPFVIFQCVATGCNLVLSGFSQINYNHKGRFPKNLVLYYLLLIIFVCCSYGYPDPSYIDRVKKQLAEKGITPSYKTGNCTSNLDFYV